MDYQVKSIGSGSDTQSSFQPSMCDIQHPAVDQNSEDRATEVCEIVKEDEVSQTSQEDRQEDISDAVEFLSVECDMILEPECDLQTDNHVSYKGGRGKRDKVRTSAAPRGSNTVLPIIYQLPLIAELFRYRDVDVYKRTCKDGPFVKIFNPVSSVSKNAKRSKHRVKRTLNNNVHGLGVVSQEDTGNVSCTELEISFSGEGDANDESQGHVDDPPNKCEICQKQFLDKNALMTHKLTHIIVTGKSYPCTVCEAKFTSKVYLRAHIQRHFCLKSVQCQFCDETFQTNNQYVIHQRVHVDEKPFQCQYCEKAFSNKFQFDNHEKTHAGKGLLKCEYCDATFTQKQALVVHERKHTGEKPFKCEKCGAAFRVRSYLRAHKKCHMDRKPRECPDCGSQFWKSSALKKHRKAEHDM
ncbi:gastrula zinc finger protein XlCGF52.1-like [Homarus americanus]|uniref:RB-associated KRAB zinc finger protein-like 1 n=1 Tax=Homarus americanus TaxID=6706 RepID=A0A8J5N355_HOMAM|nr:gastrula zinc finger protein XlCGF52.1-like [Homarus americanus]KAG7172302.1 RB-associated KRAB zinc finger protein-like 1 [Homarus americanus]